MLTLPLLRMGNFSYAPDAKCMTIFIKKFHRAQAEQFFKLWVLHNFFGNTGQMPRLHELRHDQEKEKDDLSNTIEIVLLGLGGHP